MKEWVSNLERAVELDPRNSLLLHQLSRYRSFIRADPNRLHGLQTRALTIDPDDVGHES